MRSWHPLCLILCLPWSGCSGAILGPWFPGPLDVDSDGWTIAAGDCDDRDPSISPSAPDLPKDEIDSDCDGTDALAYAVADVEPGSLVITEVMAAPIGIDDAFGEWFEIENRLVYDIEIEGLSVTDDEGDDFVVATPLLVPAGSWLVLGIWADPEQNGGVEVDYDYPDTFGLSNSADAIRLSIDGRIIDEMRWDARYPLEDGYAISLDPDADADENDLPERWCLPDSEEIYGIGGRGTPGAQNPECPAPFEGISLGEAEVGDLVITEIMADPSAVAGDFGEWFELTNTRGEDIELFGLVVSDDSGDDFEIERSLVIEGNGTIVLGSFLDREINGDTPVDFEWRWDFGLSNSGDTVRLSYGTREIDVVSYDSGYTFPDPSGASLSLSLPAYTVGLDGVSANDEGANWCIATEPYGLGDLGTPDAINPSCD